MKLVHWLLMDGLLHLVQRGGAWMGYSSRQWQVSLSLVVIDLEMSSLRSDVMYLNLPAGP